MKRYEIISQAIISKLYSLKNKFFKKRIREGLENESCEDGYFDRGDGECLKEIKTIEIFVEKPFVISIVILLLAYFSSGFLYKIKSMPLVNSGDKCKKISIGDFLNLKFGDIISGKPIIKKKDHTKKGKEMDILSKILFPSFPNDEYLYPPSSGDDYDITLKDQFFAVTRCCIVFISLFLYSFLGTMKQKIFGNKFWGTLPEIQQPPNKESWKKDLITIFPALFFFIFFLFILMGVGLILPLFFSVFWIGNVLIRWREQLDYKKNPINEIDGWKEWWFRFFGNIWRGIIALLGSMFIFLMNAFFIPVVLFFWLILDVGLGFHENKRDGIATVFQTFANIIWDYKFIWAFVAILFWVSSFETYLKGEENILSDLINEEHMIYLPHILSAVAFIFMMSQQRKYYQSLIPTPKYNKSCVPNCNAPAMSAREKGATKECPPNSSPSGTI